MAILKKLPVSGHVFYAALALLAVSGAAQAQYYPGFGPPPFPSRTGVILDHLEARGFMPVGRVARRGDVLLVDAVDPYNMPVRLVVDAYDGSILERYHRRGADYNPASRSTVRVAPPKAGIITNAEPRAPEKLAAIPQPPRRPESAAAPKPVEPRIVAPARPASEWAPINAVPIAPLN